VGWLPVVGVVTVPLESNFVVSNVLNGSFSFVLGVVMMSLL